MMKFSNREINNSYFDYIMNILSLYALLIIIFFNIIILHMHSIDIAVFNNLYAYFQRTQNRN